MFALAVFAFALCASVQGRAVNISNTWVLPEEGFPVFYRYFRDRISWYEADAVCQFHHANLVTVDTTAQYDAVRAYLKELDISSAVWVGLIRSNPDGDFTWTDYRGLGGDGYWSSAPDPRAAPLCAAADPAADYRWEARACGGPTVASFICELPVPQWALGKEGCMVKALPALTALYLPESAAVQLTADCGLAGVKRVQCTGNVKREDLLKDLSCAEDDDSSTTISVGPTGATSTVTSENLFTDQDTVNEVTTEENSTTEHEDDINQSSTIRPSTSTETLNQVFNNKQNEIYLNKNVNLDVNFNNNLQSNDIPKLGETNNFLSNELSEKLEDEKNRQHKILHEEFSRHGNFETIFTQPTDHFVPPLVMAKARISDDMTVLSLEEKHAQQLAEQRYSKLIHGQDRLGSVTSTKEPKSFDNSHKIVVTDKPSTTTNQPILEDEAKKDILKSIVPKKYNDKLNGLKNKNIKVTDIKPIKIEKTTEIYSTSTTEKAFTQSGLKYVSDVYSDKSEEEPTIDLTVIIKEPDMHKNQKAPTSDEIPRIEIIQNVSSILEPEIKLTNPIRSSGEITQEISVKLPTNSVHNFTTTHQVIKITILKDDNTSTKPTEFEFTTKMPISDEYNSTQSTSHDETTKTNTTTSQFVSTEKLSTSHTPEIADSTTTTVSANFVTNTTVTATEHNETAKTGQTFATAPTLVTTTSALEKVTNDDDKYYSTESNSSIIDVQVTTEKEFDEMETESEDGLVNNTTDTSQTIDDFQSPLLSAANEPLHRPNRSRRPQPPIRNKFNPFRILG